MNILDYVILGALVISLIIGLVKGLLKQILALVSIFVVVTLTATVTPYVDSWLVNVIQADGTRALVAMIASAILLAVVCGLISWLIGKALKKVKILKALDRILGGVMGIAIVYLIFAVLFALLTSTGEEFMAGLKGMLGGYLEDSWFAAHVYNNNFFGDWVINGIAQKLMEALQPAA